MAHFEELQFRLAGCSDAEAVAQAFYQSRGGRCVGQALVPPPGGVASRLIGSPAELQYVWPEPAVLLERP